MNRTTKTLPNIHNVSPVTSLDVTAWAEDGQGLLSQSRHRPRRMSISVAQNARGLSNAQCPISRLLKSCRSPDLKTTMFVGCNAYRAGREKKTQILQLGDMNGDRRVNEPTSTRSSPASAAALVRSDCSLCASSSARRADSRVAMANGFFPIRFSLFAIRYSPFAAASRIHPPPNTVPSA